MRQSKVEQKLPIGHMGQRIIDEPWSVVAADVIGPYTRLNIGFEYVLIFMDMFTRWIELIPLCKLNAKKIIEAFYKFVINRWGAPRIFLPDNGNEFSNKKVDNFLESVGISHTFTPPYHAQANPVERLNRVYKTMITSFLEKDHRDWDVHLDEFLFAYNTAVHSSLKVSLAYLNLGHDLHAKNDSRRADTVP